MQSVPRLTPPDSPRPHNLFFALRPDAKAAIRIGRLARGLARRHDLTGPQVDETRLHVSLNSLGREETVPNGLLARASEAVAALGMPSFVVGFDRVVTFETRTPRRPVVLTADDGVTGVLMLYSALHRALMAVGLASGGERRIAPHLTLLRAARAIPETFIEPISWRAHELVLIDSLVGQGRHAVLGRWRLASAGS